MNYIVILGQVASNDGVKKIGDKITLSPEEAQALIKLGYLKPVAKQPTMIKPALNVLNSMSEAELEGLPGIGKTKATALFNQGFESLEVAQNAAGMSDQKWADVIEALTNSVHKPE